MHKIFKYKLTESRTVELPINAKIIRIDHVNDGYYHGDFVWAIVDPEEKEKETLKFDEAYVSRMMKEVNKDHLYNDLTPVRIRITEVQEVELPGHAVSAGGVDGDIFLYCDEYDDRKDVVHLYKTGQSFKIHPDKLRYVGLNTIWIKQELGLYTFIVRKDDTVFSQETHEEEYD